MAGPIGSKPRNWLLQGAPQATYNPWSFHPAPRPQYYQEGVLADPDPWASPQSFSSYSTSPFGDRLGAPRATGVPQSTTMPLPAIMSTSTPSRLTSASSQSPSTITTPRVTSAPFSTMGSRLINTIEPGGYESGMPMFDPSRIKPVDRAVILNNNAFPKKHFQYLLDAYESGSTEEEIRASLVGTGVILPSDFFTKKTKKEGETNQTGGGNWYNEWNRPMTEWEQAFAQEHAGQSPVEAYGGGTTLPSGQYMSQGQAQAMAEFDRDWGANYASMHGKAPSQQEWENSYKHRLEMFYNNANPFGG